MGPMPELIPEPMVDPLPEPLPAPMPDPIPKPMLAPQSATNTEPLLKPIMEFTGHAVRRASAFTRLAECADDRLRALSNDNILLRSKLEATIGQLYKSNSHASKVSDELNGLKLANSAARARIETLRLQLELFSAPLPVEQRDIEPMMQGDVCDDEPMPPRAQAKIRDIRQLSQSKVGPKGR